MKWSKRIVYCLSTTLSRLGGSNLLQSTRYCCIFQAVCLDLVSVTIVSLVDCLKVGYVQPSWYIPKTTSQAIQLLPETWVVLQFTHSVTFPRMLNTPTTYEYWCHSTALRNYCQCFVEEQLKSSTILKYTSYHLI